jgi:hypothetical protein
VKKGTTYGETDDYCYNIVRDPVHVHDLNATILHLLGINHERLTFPLPRPRLPPHRHPRMKPLLFAALALTTLSTLHAVTPDGKQKLVFIAGKPSHPPGMHEFRAGTMLLEKCLKSVPNLVVDRHEMGWVSDEKTFADADAVVIYADGGGKHPAVVDGHLETLRN